MYDREIRNEGEKKIENSKKKAEMRENKERK